MVDYTIKQGDTLPVLVDFLTLADGSIPNFNGCTLQFVMRALTNTQPQTLTGTATFTNVSTGQVQFAPTAADTAVSGYYMGNWQVTFPSTATMTWPTAGYLSIAIEESLGLGAPAVVSLPDAKDYINIQPSDRSHDAKLLGYINAATALIENAVGPVIIRSFDEWHAGGQYFIQLRRRPSFALGTTPVYNILACDEYRGPVKYSLSVVPEPTQASIYSVMLDKNIGTLYRRTTGGGVIPFGAGPFGGAMPDAVHVIYQAGQQTVPWNVREAALETVRWNFESTQPTGLGSRALADNLDIAGGPKPFAMPPSAMQLLTPMRRYPACA